MSEFADRVAIVTGGGSGVGRALVVELVRRSARVIVADIDANAIAETVAATSGAARGAVVDVRDPQAMRELVQATHDEHGRLDYMFNNAGVGVDGEVHTLTVEQWDLLVDVNIRGVIHGVMAAYPLMVQQGHGHIVNTASSAGLVPVPLVVPYSMTKHAVVGLSQALRLEAAAHGVKVTTLCPATIETPMLDATNPGTTAGQAIDRRAYLSMFNEPVPVEAAARRALDGVLANESLVVFPGSARRAWRLYRFVPRLVERVLSSMAARMKGE